MLGFGTADAFLGRLLAPGRGMSQAIWQAASVITVVIWGLLEFFCENGEAVTGIATILLAAITYMLVKLGQEQSKTSRAQLRAYVFVDGAGFQQPPLGQNSWYIHLLIRNFGTTPAYAAIPITQWEIGAHRNETTVFPIGAAAVAHPKTMIPPGHAHTIRIHCPPIGAGLDGWASQGAADHRAYLWGRVDYRDAFDMPHWAKFQMTCYFGTVSSFAYCEAGNESD